MRRVIIGPHNYSLASPRWFPPQVSEEILTASVGECVPWTSGNGKREYQRVFSSQRSLKLRGWEGREAIVRANCQFSAGQAMMSLDLRRKTGLESFCLGFHLEKQITKSQELWLEL